LSFNTNTKESQKDPWRHWNALVISRGQGEFEKLFSFFKKTRILSIHKEKRENRNPYPVCFFFFSFK
jgi:hypothetical protein